MTRRGIAGGFLERFDDRACRGYFVPIFEHAYLEAGAYEPGGQRVTLAVDANPVVLEDLPLFQDLYPRVNFM